jgi:hypothetical protein
MRIRARLELLEELATALGLDEDVAPAEIWMPYTGRGDPLPGRHPCPGSRCVLVIYDPAKTVPPVAEALP